jgi:hypothetical protein
VHSTSYPSLGDPTATATAWHTYTIEKVPGRSTEYIDGVRSATSTSGSPSWFDKYYEANESWDLQVNLQIGGGSGNQPDATTHWTPSRTTMIVGWIRTWALSS